MTLQEINELLRENCESILLDRLSEKFPEASGIFTDEEYELELASYKNYLIQEKKDELKERIDTLSDLRMCMVNAGLDQPNPALLVKDILDSFDEDRIAALEAADASIVAAKASVEYKDLRKAAYEAAGLTFEKFIEYMTEDNEEAIADYKATKLSIQQQYPKPE